VDENDERIEGIVRAVLLAPWLHWRLLARALSLANQQSFSEWSKLDMCIYECMHVVTDQC